MPATCRPPPTPAPFDATGSLATADVPWLLSACYRARATGLLEVRGRVGTRTVYLELGRVVGAHSQVSAEGLSEVAYRLGRITAEARRWLLTNAAGVSPRRAALALVEGGHLKAQELYDTVRAQTLAALFGAFSEDEGTWQWHEVACEEEARVALPEHPFALVMEGVRRKYPMHRIHRRLGGPATVVALREGADLSLLGLSSRERRIAERVDGTRSAEELVFLGGLGEEATYQVLYGLVVTGLAELKVRGPMPEGRAGSPEVAEAELRIDRERIEEKFRQAVDADYFEILGITPDATGYEIREAWERLVREFNPANFGAPAYRDLWGKLEEIRRALDDAYEVLRDEGLRADYLEALRRAGGGSGA